MPNDPRHPAPRTLGEAVVAQWKAAAQPHAAHHTADPTTEALASLSDATAAATDELSRLALMDRAGTPSPHGPAKPCCRSATTDARLTRLGDPLSHIDTPGEHGVLRVTLDEGARLPRRSHPYDAGLDLWATENSVVRLMPHETRVFDTGVHVEIPVGHVGIIATRSGMARRSIEVGGGIIDAEFRGPLGVALTNHGQAQWVAQPSTAIAQLLVVPCLLLTPMVVDGLGATARGGDGFGSSDLRGDGK